MKTELSIVIPVYNEQDSVKILFSKLNELSNKLPKNTEIIIVNDGSTDKTAINIKNNRLKYKKVLLSFSRNFGHQSALIAGLKKANGKVVVTMDGDLQHPPELITKMLELNKQGYELVLTQKIDNEITSGFKKISSSYFYKIINVFSQTEIVNNASDFRLIQRNALDQILDLPEKRIFLRGLVNWVGFEKVIIPFEVQQRVAGESKYTLKKMLVLAFSGITSFSTIPLYFAGFTGLILSLLSLIYSIYIILEYSLNRTVSGWASMLLVSLIIGSAVFIFLGVIGVYIAAIYDEVKGRPNYILKETYNENK